MVHKPVLSLPCKEFRNPVWNEQIWQFSGRYYFLIDSDEVTLCHGNDADKGEIRHDEICLDWSEEGGNVILLNCHGKEGNQKWSFNKRYKYDLYTHSLYI